MNDEKYEERTYRIAFHKIERFIKEHWAFETHKFISFGRENLFVMQNVYRGNLPEFISKIMSFIISIGENGIDEINWDGMEEDIREELLNVGHKINSYPFKKKMFYGQTF